MFGEIKLADRLITNLRHVISIQENNCVRLKHKHSTCQACITNCPTEAIKVGSVRGHIAIDWEKCIACGICTNVCNTEVYALKLFSDRDLMERGRKVIHSYKNFEIRCKKINEKTTPGTIEINCLGFINTAHIVAFAAYGAEALHLRYADCDTCDAKWGKKLVLDNIKNSEDIINAFNFNKSFTLSSGNCPANFTSHIEEDQLVKKGESLTRREFFQYFKQRAKHSTAKTISTLWNTDSIPTKIPVGNAKKYLPKKRQLLLAGLGVSEPPDDRLLETSTISMLTGMEIDISKCGLCESCARFCPTGAITQETVRNIRGKKVEAELKFNPSRCVKCGLCLEACFTEALSYSTHLSNKYLIEECDLLLISQ